MPPSSSRTKKPRAFSRPRRIPAGLASGLALTLTLAHSADLHAAGGYPQPDICDRTCWQARPPQGSISQLTGLTRALIHHTAIATDYDTGSLEDSKAKVRAIQNLHMDVNAWSDVGYHFLADTLGNSFEGRDGAISTLPRGAHDGINDKSYGFSMLGYFHPPYNQEPTVAHRCAIYKLIAWRIPDPYTAYGSSPYGTLPDVGYLGGHRNAKATDCPGDLMYNYIGLDFSGGEARDEINALITTGVSPLCDDGPLCCPSAPTLRSVTAAGDDITVRWSDVGKVTLYRLYSSADGMTFGAPIDLPVGTTQYVDADVPPGTVRYYKVTALGTEQESLSSDVYGIRVDGAAADVLIVDGNDHPTSQASADLEHGNHAFAALAGQAIAGLSFDTVENDTVARGHVALDSYSTVIWLLGEDSSPSETFSSGEQALVAAYLDAGGHLFVSGADVGWALSEKGSSADEAFYNTYLRATYVGDDGGQHLASPAAAGLFDGLAPIDLSPDATNAVYPDLIAPNTGASTALYYTDRTGKKPVAGISYDAAYKLVYLSFPFESIASDEARAAVMERVLTFFDPTASLAAPAPSLRRRGSE